MQGTHVPRPTLNARSWPDPAKFRLWVKAHASQLGMTGKHIEQGLEDALQCLTLRDNEQSGTLDKRRRSTKYIADTGNIPSENYRGVSMQEIDSQTSRSSETERLKFTLSPLYHEAQRVLFILEGVDKEYAISGQMLRRKRDGKALSADEFGDVISELTMRQYDLIVKDTLYETCSICQVKRDHDEDLKRLCYAVDVVFGRYSAQNVCENDLSDEKQWRVWRKHAVVLTTFAVYCATLDAYIHKQYGKCGFESIAERGDSLSVWKLRH